MCGGFGREAAGTPETAAKRPETAAKRPETAAKRPETAANEAARDGREAARDGREAAAYGGAYVRSCACFATRGERFRKMRNTSTADAHEPWRSAVLPPVVPTRQTSSPILVFV